MSSQEVGCGSHGVSPEGVPVFDYTCDDCMLPDVVDPPEL